MEASRPITPAFAANAVALPDMPSRSEARLISSGMEIAAGNTVADSQCDHGNIAVGGCTNVRLRQFPNRVVELRLELRDRGIDAADLGIQRESGALLCSLGRDELRRHRLVLDLLVLRLELRVG